MALLGVILIVSAGGLLFKPSQYEGLMVVVDDDNKSVLEIPLNGEPSTVAVKGNNMEQIDENGEPILNEDGSTKTANVATLVRDENGETTRTPFQRLPEDYGPDLRYPYPSSVAARPFSGVLGQEGFVHTYALGSESVPPVYYSPDGAGAF